MYYSFIKLILAALSSFFPVLFSNFTRYEDIDH